MSEVSVFITIDTEHSIGGAFHYENLKPVGNDRRIFWRACGKDHGIGLIADIAEYHGLRLCFFPEVLNKYYFGEEESKSVCRYIMGRGHDVQLHLHPNYLNFATPDHTKREFSDLMHTYSLKQQIEFIADGRESLMKYGAGNVVAFRAGNFGANPDTLTALENTGFLIDSSYNRSFLGKDCQLTDILSCDTLSYETGEIGDCDLSSLDICDAEQVGNIWEFPITNFSESDFRGGRRLRPMDINGASFAQMRKVLDEAVEKGPRNITILMHSFSFINPSDLQYRRIRPRTAVIRRFEQLCRYLAANRDKFRVLTFGDLNRHDLNNMKGKSLHHLPKLDIALSLGRAAEQAWDLLPKGAALRQSLRENCSKGTSRVRCLTSSETSG